MLGVGPSVVFQAVGFEALAGFRIARQATTIGTRGAAIEEFTRN